MFENLNITDSRDIIFENKRLDDSIKFKLLKRQEYFDRLCKEHNLFDYVLGTVSFNEIKKLLPRRDVQLYDLKLNPKKFADYLRSYELIHFEDKVMKYIENEAHNLIKYYDNQQSFYRKFSTSTQSYESIVWVNSLSTLFLLKWFIYIDKIDRPENNRQNIKKKIISALEWLQYNFTRNKEDILQYIIYSDKPSQLSNVIKMYETSLVLQLLLRTKKYKSLNVDIGLKFSPIVDQLLDIKDEKTIDSQKLTRWPSDIILNSQQGNGRKKEFDSDVGSTSLVLQLLSEILREDSGVTLTKKQLQSVKHEILKGILWLVSQQDKNTGSWGRGDNYFSIEQSCHAIQAILKLDLLLRERVLNNTLLNNRIKNQIVNAVKKGITWISQQFCLNNGNAFIYAWPEEDIKTGDIINKPCCKNTALAVSTLLKAGANPGSFLILKPVMWLLTVTPEYKFDNIYKYCALVDYLRILHRRSD